MLPLLVLLFFVKLTTAVPVVSFQTDNVPSTTSYLRYKKPIPELTQFAFCFRVFLDQARNPTSILSYAVQEFDNEVNLYIHNENKIIRLSCCGNEVIIEVKYELNLKQWQSVCMSVDLDKKTYSFIDNTRSLMEQKINSNNEDLKVKGGGILYLGQEQDSFDGGMNPFQSLSGSLLGFEFFKEVLFQTYMEAYVDCNPQNDTYSPLIDFTDFKDSFNTIDVQISDIDLDDSICESKSSYDLFFPQRRTYAETEQLCHASRGSVKLPKSDLDSIQLFDKTNKFIDECSKGNTDLIWIGVKGHIVSQNWMYYKNGKYLDYTNYVQGNDKPITEDRLCTTFYGSLDDAPAWYRTWQPQSCSLERCFVCEYEQIELLQMRGLCSNSLFDRKYFIYESSTAVSIFGEYYSVIEDITTDDNEVGSWILKRFDKPEVRAVLKKNSEKQYPFGLNTWEIFNDLCGVSSVSLLLSSCTENQFACNDGTCIERYFRCDTEFHCKDGSDEIDCNKIIYDKQYSRKISPPRPWETVPLDIKYYIGLNSISNINYASSFLKLDIEIFMKWRDSRLRFKNLKNDGTPVSLDEIGNNLWMPKIEFPGSTELESGRPSIKILMDASPLPDNDEFISTDYIYLGKDNPLHLRQRFTFAVSCRFDLTMFPFDMQLCTQKITLNDVTSDYAKFLSENGGSLIFGERVLNEYVLSDLSSTVLEEDGFSTVELKLCLTNLSSYYIWTGFLPSCLIVLLGYLSLYISLNGFIMRLIVALAGFMIQSIWMLLMNQNIPKTNYLKLIDLWGFACVLIMLIIVIAILWVDHVKNNETKPIGCLFRKTKVSTKEELSQILKEIPSSNKRSKGRAMNFTCRIFILVLFVSFVAFYCLIVGLLYLSYNENNDSN